MAEKESTRAAWHSNLGQDAAPQHWGKAAEKLRGLPLYRDVVTVFATPGEALHQVRINCLVDGKNLLMPAPSLRAGFILLPGHTLPFKYLSAAVSYKGLEKYGQLLKYEAMATLRVGMLFTGSLAVDITGGRLGDGNGFFDLCCALLQELGCLQQDAAVWTVVREEQISRALLPQDTWDIKVSGAVTPAGLHTFEPPPQKPRIFWDQLPMDRIKKIDPLWKLYSARRKG